MKLMNTGAMVVLVNDSASFSGLNHFGTQFPDRPRLHEGAELEDRVQDGQLR